jgi:hypothetical protein
MLSFAAKIAAEHRARLTINMLAVTKNRCNALTGRLCRNFIHPALANSNLTRILPDPLIGRQSQHAIGGI